MYSYGFAEKLPRVAEAQTHPSSHGADPREQHGRYFAHHASPRRDIPCRRQEAVSHHHGAASEAVPRPVLPLVLRAAVEVQLAGFTAQGIGLTAHHAVPPQNACNELNHLSGAGPKVDLLRLL